MDILSVQALRSPESQDVLRAQNNNLKIRKFRT